MAANNDGSIVLSLFFAAGTIAGVVFRAALFYAEAVSVKNESAARRCCRLLSGWANLGNAAIHAMLVGYITANADNTSSYWEEERKLGGIEGPAGLCAFNTIAGLLALRSISMTIPLCWNVFVAFAGLALPVVWPRFVEKGLSEWPYTIIFIWWVIFFMELTAVAASATHFAIGKKKKKGE